MNSSLKRYFMLFAVVTSLLLSCGHKPKMIPEKEMGDIIVQTVLTESFLRATNRYNATDSMDIYLPIVEKLGYSMEDFNFTFDKMVRRKSNVLSVLLDKMTIEVAHIKDRYEYLNNMGRGWKEKVRNDVLDTLYFSPDTIRITSATNLSQLDYSVPVYQEGELIISYNYLISENDKNPNRYMIYKGIDTLSKKQGIKSHYWLSRNMRVSKFEKEVLISNPAKNNKFDIRIFSSSSDIVKGKSNDSTDIYIDSVMIRFRPRYEDGNKILLDRYRVYNTLYNIGARYNDNDSLIYTGPFNEKYSVKRKIEKEQFRIKKK